MSAPIAEGQILAGKYRVERILGQGGMGVVVAAVHQQLQQRVAIKFLVGGADAESIQRFLREARSAVRLKSEHVARVLDVAELEDGTPYMVMEYLKGIDLSQALRQGGPLPIEQAVTHMLDVCEAIAEAHAAGIIHRDLKPANLFLTTAADGSQMVKVLDFGISKASLGAPEGGLAEQPPDMALTRTQSILGSPLYMSPEQMRSARSVDARTDIWSMGAILYQLLTGRVPFDTTSFPELILMVSNEDPPLPRVFRPDLPEALEAAILGCLRKPLGERFANVGVLAQAIAPFASEEAQASLPRILRTLGLPAASQSLRYGSRPSFPAVSVPASRVTPSGSFESNRPPRSSSPGGAPRISDVPPRADAQPYMVARTAQSPAGSESMSTASSRPVVKWPATDPGSRPAARRSQVGAVVALLVTLFVLGGGVLVGLRYRARSEEPLPATAEASPMLPSASRPPGEGVQPTAAALPIVAAAAESAPSVAPASVAPAALPSASARAAHIPVAVTPKPAPAPKATSQASAAARTSQSPFEKMNEKGIQ